MTALGTIADVAAVSRAVPDADVDQVERLLEMVSAQVRRYTGLTFDLIADDPFTVRPDDGDLILPEWPITAATAVQQGSTVTLEIGSAGRLYRTVGDARRRWPDAPVTGTYTHGFDPIPDDIVMVVAEVAAERWNASAVNPTQISGSTSQDVAGYSTSQSYRIPSTATEAWSGPHQAILDSYKPGKFGTIRLVS